METLRLLVVDDEAGIRHSITRALRSYDVQLPEVDTEVRFDIESASSGEEALRLVEASPPDIILLDYKMSGMSGLEVLQKLQEQSRDLLVIMVTAFATIETAVRATKSGAFDFITKPLTPEELKSAVRKTTCHLVAQRKARKLSEEKRRIRFEFIRVLGHELKAPLGVIESYLKLVQNRISGPEIAAYDEMVGRCLARAEGMRKLIDDLLDLTRIESGEKKRELVSIDVAEVARAALEAQKPGADQRGISTSLRAPEALEMVADRGEIEIILSNLLSNGVKYNRDGGQLHVELDGDDRTIRLAVRDTGIGIGPDDAAKLFDDFVRIKNESTRNILGSGLGLSIVKKIAKLYGGKVSVQSELGAGSTFTVVLERRPAEAAADQLARPVA
ncbi:MAG: response regulator [Planctomycetes bacterium]|nr:response regulator [Planctomycetota bacterium]